MRHNLLRVIIAAAAAFVAVPAAAAPAELYTWCSLALISKDARLSSVFMAEEGRGNDVMARWFERVTGRAPDRTFQCKQFGSQQEADQSLAEAVAKLRAAGFTASRLDLSTGELQPF